MHINSTGIFGHIFMVVGLILILYYLSQIIDPLMSNNKTVITEVEKLRLIYKLELMTIAVFIFVAVADFFK